MKMDIVSSLNDKYTRYACVMLTSLLINQKEDNEIHIYLLNSSLEEDNKGYLQGLEGLHANAHIHFLDVNREDFSSVEKHVGCWSLETYFRLQAFELLPVDMDKFLYLDVDTIVNKPLDELFEYDIPEEIDVIGAVDTGHAPFGDTRDVIFSKWIDEGSLLYICAGVTLWNLKVLRNRVNLNKYLEIAESLNYSMTAPDQDLINYMHQGKMAFWGDDISYGVFSKYMYNKGHRYEDILKQSFIIHYAGRKPWEGQYVHYDIEKIWWDYAKKTEFYQGLMEDFVNSAITIPVVYDALYQAMCDKEKLQDELNKSIALNEKMLGIINGKK